MNDGGPAFPIVEYAETCSIDKGISVRDYFAAKAMQSLIIVCKCNDTKDIPQEAYKMADTMLRAREDL